MVGFLAGVPWLKLVTVVPAAMNAATKLYDSVRGRPRSQPTQDLTGLQKRLDAIEGYQETQTELMAELTQHHAVLLRWLLVLTLALVVMGGVAIAGLVVALLR